jgi:hypothetical protein
MGTNLAAVDLGAGRTAVSVSAGWTFTCALLVSRCQARREQLENANAFALIVAQTQGIIWPRLAYLVQFSRLWMRVGGLKSWGMVGLSDILSWSVGSERGWRVYSGKRRGVGVGEDGQTIWAEAAVALATMIY